MPTEYLDKAGLEYFWSKLKVYIAAQSGGGGGAGGIGDGVPVGMVMDFAGTSLTVPTGYLICDGSAVSRTDYAELFAVIGTTWGAGDGSTTFNLPDFRGRTAIGAGTGTATDATAHALASLGGAETHHHDGGSYTLTIADIPEHNHKSSSTTAGQDFRFMAFKPESGVSGSFNLQLHGSGANRYAYASTATENLSYYSSTANAGGGGAHSHGATTDTSSMQPYATVNKIIKAVPDTPASGGIDMSTTTASLGTTGWSNNSKTINVTGVTASNTVIISPAPADADAWAAAGIVCTAQGSGTLTFSCDTVPSTSITANILILTEEE